MARKQAKRTEDPENSPSAEQGGSKSPTAEQFRALQFRILAQEAIPVQLPIILKTGADVAEFGIKLIDLKLRRQISARDLISLKGVLDVVLKAIMPQPGTQVNVTQHLIAPSNFDRYTEEEQEQLVRAIKLIESKASTG